MSNLIYYGILGALVAFIINYFDLSPKKSLILAIIIGGIAGIISTYVF
ncbi:MAG: hypothetical protein ACOC4L_03070 [Halanaerobium sp.]